MRSAEQQTETMQQLTQLHGCHHKGMSLTALQVHNLSHTSGCLCDMGDWVSWYVSGCQDLGEPSRGQRQGRHEGQASFACGALADPRLQFRNQAGMFAKLVSGCTQMARIPWGECLTCFHGRVGHSRCKSHVWRVYLSHLMHLAGALCP